MAWFKNDLYPESHNATLKKSAKIFGKTVGIAAAAPAIVSFDAARRGNKFKENQVSALSKGLTAWLMNALSFNDAEERFNRIWQNEAEPPKEREHFVSTIPSPGE